MKSILKLAFVVSLLALLSSCATILSDSVYPVYVESNPSSMELVIEDQDGFEIYRGTTPSIVNLEASSGYFRAARYTVTVYRDGKEVGSRSIYGKLDNWYWGNILTGGLIGFFLVDPVTGAMWKLPERVMVTDQ